ncbi:MAG: DciA family protein [Thalassobaculales bacterium]
MAVKDQRPRPSGLHPSGLRPVGAALPAVTRTALRKLGAVADLALRWPDIVGPLLAAGSRPDRLARPAGVLTVIVDGAAALELQHLEPQMIERINAFLGARLVTRLRLTQGRLPPPPPVPPAAAAAAAAAPPAPVSGIADPDLALALARLGASLEGARKKP